MLWKRFLVNTVSLVHEHFIVLNYFFFHFLSIFCWLCYYSCPIFFLPFIPLHPASCPHPAFLPTLSSCPWVVHISFLASPFPILFLTSHVYFVPTIYASNSLYLFPHSPLPHPSESPPCDLHFYDSVPVLVICLVCFCVFRFSCW